MLTKNLFKLKQHSRRVLITKRSLPIFAFLVASLILAWPLFSPHKEKFTLAVAPLDKRNTKIAMENLRFFGLNEKKLPMTLKTPKIQEEKRNVAKMIKPIGTYQFDNEDILTMNSPYALIDKKGQTVFFEDRISGKTESKYVIQASQVLFDYDQGTADSNSPVRITGPAGKLNAQGVWMADKGNLILFKKKSTAQIKNDKGPVHVSAAQGIQIDQKEKTITAMEQAKVTQNEMTLKADKIILFYTDNKKERIREIQAFGHVQIDNKKQTMTGNEGTYHPKTKISTMTGNVLLRQGSHSIRGDKATLNLATGKSDLISKERITGTIMPDALKGE